MRIEEIRLEFVYAYIFFTYIIFRISILLPRACVCLSRTECVCVCVWNIHIYDKCVCQAVKCVKNYVHIDTSYLILLQKKRKELKEK